MHYIISPKPELEYLDIIRSSFLLEGLGRAAPYTLFYLH